MFYIGSRIIGAPKFFCDALLQPALIKELVLSGDSGARAICRKPIKAAGAFGIAQRAFPGGLSGAIRWSAGAERREMFVPTRWAGRSLDADRSSEADSLLCAQAVRRVPFAHWKTTFGLPLNGFVAPLVLDGLVNAAAFEALTCYSIFPPERFGVHS